MVLGSWFQRQASRRLHILELVRIRSRVCEEGGGHTLALIRISCRVCKEGDGERDRAQVLVSCRQQVLVSCRQGVGVVSPTAYLHCYNARLWSFYHFVVVARRRDAAKSA